MDFDVCICILDGLYLVGHEFLRIQELIGHPPPLLIFTIIRETVTHRCAAVKSLHDKLVSYAPAKASEIGHNDTLNVPTKSYFKSWVLLLVTLYNV